MSIRVVTNSTMFKADEKPDETRIGRRRLRKAEDEKACDGCGVMIQATSVGHGKIRRFCSKACYFDHQRRRHPRHGKRCEVCNGELNREQISHRTSSCSPKCAAVLRAAKRRMRPCNQCGMPYQPSANSPKHCSRKCYIASRQHATESFECCHCGTAVQRWKTNNRKPRRRFCSRACRRAHLVGSEHHAFRGGPDPNRGAKWEKLAESIRERDCFACRRCGLCQNANGLKKFARLSVDHVRPWRTFADKALANHPDNLVALCLACHAHKTTVIEREWLKGNVLPWKQWVASLHLPSAKFGWIA